MPSTTRSAPSEDGERPSKRTKVSSEEKVVEVAAAVNDDDDDDLEEETSQEPAEVRASDLYLDTASAFQLFYVGLMLICSRLTGSFSILTSRKCVQCPSPTSTSTAV